MTREYTVFVTYSDDSEFSFTVKIEGADHDIMANLMMITRGTLMASSAKRSVCYNDQGFDVCAYEQ